MSNEQQTQMILQGESVVTTDERRYDILRFYQQQGYELPAGITAEAVIEQQRQYKMDPIFVPIASVPGVCTGWGVPFKDGKPLMHP